MKTMVEKMKYCHTPQSVHHLIPQYTIYYQFCGVKAIFIHKLSFNQFMSDYSIQYMTTFVERLPERKQSQGRIQDFP